jgi:hypothetical protein
LAKVCKNGKGAVTMFSKSHNTLHTMNNWQQGDDNNNHDDDDHELIFGQGEFHDQGDNV